MKSHNRYGETVEPSVEDFRFSLVMRHLKTSKLMDSNCQKITNYKTYLFLKIQKSLYVIEYCS